MQAKVSWVRRTMVTAAALIAVSPLLAQCGGLPGVPGVPGLPGGKCPDMNDPAALADFDWAGSFKLDAKLGASIKAGVIAAASLDQVTKSIDADLKTGCGGLATDLGAGSEFKSGEEACKAAAKAVTDFKAKLGAGAKIGVDIAPPKCAASLDAYANCAGKCDVNVKPGSAKVECEAGKLQGECSGSCEGSCDLQAAAKCDGTCSGKCDVAIKGSCGGKCDGKCDGKPSKASCSGVCDGKCDGDVQAECKGNCSGSCKMKAKAECKGTCSGSCSVEMKAPKCTGEVKPPEMSADCKAQCDAQVSAKLECSPARVIVKIEGAADAKAVGQFKGAIEKNAPIILKVALGMGEKAAKMGESVKGMVDNVQGSVTGAVSAAGSDPMKAATMGSLAACVAGPFKGAIGGAASMQGSLKASVDVKASFSASGSASGSAGK